MKTQLRLQAMILCLIILPFITTAQKQLSSVKITAKRHVSVSSLLAGNTGIISSELKNQFIQTKLRLNLGQERNGNSPLLPKYVSGKNNVSPAGGGFNLDEVEVGSPPPLSNFRGAKDSGFVYPPDASGAVGPNHVMHVNEQQYVFYDKSGTVLGSLSPDDFWSGFAGTAFVVAYPHVEYDAQLGHFYILSLGGDVSSGDYAVLFGSSDTNDPTGSWTLWEVDMGPAFIQDAPVMGYSKRWFTYTTMQYDTAAPNNFNSTGVVLMSITGMIAGTLSSVFGLDDVNFFGLSPVETLDANINNHYLISNVGSSADTGYLFVVHIAGTLIAPTYNYDGYVKKTSPWSADPAFASQLGTTNKIYPGSTRLRNAVYRNGQIWTCHTVYLPEPAPTRAAAQWWQIKVSDLSITQFGRVEDKKNNDKFYGYPSLAVNKHNDMLMGYTQFSSATYASAGYSYRNATDAVNKLRKTKLYKKGKATYFDGGSSGVTYDWGTYSATCVDDADSSFWTVQEYAESPADTWGTWWAHVDNAVFPKASSPDPIQVFENRSVINISPNPANNLATLNWNEERSVAVKIQVSNNQGNILIARDFIAQKGSNKLSLNVASLISGVYTVVISNGVDSKKAQLVIE